MRGLSIELKMIIGAILFAVVLVGVERYQITDNIVQQFIESKKSKNRLLINTIAPVIALNLSLGLDDANIEYLSKIIKQNPDLLSFTMIDTDGKTLFTYSKKQILKHQENIEGAHYLHQLIKDPVTDENIAMVSLHFDDHEYQTMLQRNNEATFRLFLILFLFLIAFILYIKSQFRFLGALTESVLKYDPQINNLNLIKSSRTDEVGIIHNAIIKMVEKINFYSRDLEDLNQSLEEKIRERTQELEKVNLQLQELSLTDTLSNLPNRRYLENHLEDIRELSKRKKVVTSIIMCDIDYFKLVNDKYGHVVGDFVLREIAIQLKMSLKRSSDFIARYGGEEFIIVLYDTDIESAQKLCYEIQMNLKKINRLKYQNILLDPITLSFGIASNSANKEMSSEDLINFADQALYQAKKTGRDRFVSISN